MEQLSLVREESHIPKAQLSQGCQMSQGWKQKSAIVEVQGTERAGKMCTEVRKVRLQPAQLQTQDSCLNLSCKRRQVIRVQTHHLKLFCCIYAITKVQLHPLQRREAKTDRKEEHLTGHCLLILAQIAKKPDVQLSDSFPLKMVQPDQAIIVVTLQVQLRQQSLGFASLPCRGPPCLTHTSTCQEVLVVVKCIENSFQQLVWEVWLVLLGLGLQHAIGCQA